MYAALPLLADLPFDHPWHRMDEAAHAMFVHAAMSGARAGAAYEHLGLALLTPTRVCGTCDGVGSLGENGGHYPHGGERHPCPDCGGRGTVPTPAPTLRLAADWKAAPCGRWRRPRASARGRFHVGKFVSTTAEPGRRARP